MSKHTPGPWRVEHQNPSPTTGEWMIAGSKPGYLAEVRDCGSGDVRANARLIAAAPDLLEACELIVSAFDQLAPMSSARNEPLQINAARAAIAKARGEQ